MADDLCEKFGRFVVRTITASNYELRYCGGHVVAMQFIPAHSVIGEIHGTPTYIDEADSNARLMYVSGDCVLEVADVADNMLGMCRMGTCEDDANATIMPDEYQRCFLMAYRDIQPFQKIIYVPMDLVMGD